MQFIVKASRVYNAGLKVKQVQ